MDILTLNAINCEYLEGITKVCYLYSAPDNLRKMIKGSALYVEYPGDMRAVPESILAIPFVGVMLTVGMLINMKIHVPVLDKTFSNSIEKIETVFQQMYPNAGIRCDVEVDNLQENTCIPEEDGKCSLFFTGGVDATSALFELIEKKPLLVNIWGGDLRLTDDASHRALERYLDQLTNHLSLDYCFIKTNAREMFDEDALGFVCRKLGRRKNHGWWASIAHILSMVSVTVPLLWHKGIAVHGIGSSYDPSTSIFDSNNGTLINAMKMLGCRFVSVDDKLDRNEKVEKIVAYQKKYMVPIEVKVCWRRSAGKNCSGCEKCYRTILNLIVNHADPNRYGFYVDGNTSGQVKEFVQNNTVSLAFWIPIQNAMRVDRDFWEDTEWAWFLDARLNSMAVVFKRIKRLIFSKLKGTI